MTRTLVAVAVTLLGVLAGVSLVLHDSFYAAMGVRPEDAGVSEWDTVVRGVVYLGLPVGAAGIACAGVFVLAASRKIDENADRRKLVLLAALTVVVAAAVAVGIAALMAPGALAFASASTFRMIGGLIIVLAFATVLAVLLGFGRRAGKGASLVVSWAALAVMLTASVPALLLARSAGKELAADARGGSQLQPGALDPLQVRAQPACLLTPDAAATTVPVKRFVLLGESTGGALLYDPEEERSFVIAPSRLGVLGRSGDLCREPGEPTPIETGTPADDAALAKRFRPVLRFDSREPWRPLDIERFVSETFPDAPSHHLVCESAERCRPLTSTADLNSSAVRLNLRGTRKNGSDQKAPCAKPGVVLECDSEASAIYYNVTRQDRRVYVDYWWFLRYNHFPFPAGPSGPCGGTSTPKSQHEGDWEGVTVVTKFGQPDDLDFVTFASHTHSFRYRKLRLERDGVRPVIYSACGSHASYPRSCRAVRGCRQTAACLPNPCRNPVSSVAEAPSDGKAEWHRNGDEACFTGQPCLLPLPTAQPAEGGASPQAVWTTWSGRWGVSGSPRSPGRQVRFRHPWDSVLSDRVRFDSRAPGEAPESG